MAIKSIAPYLMFDGTAEQAIELYEKALGARVEGDIMRFKYAPGEGARAASREAQCVMHAQLRIGNAVLMLSDGEPGKPLPKESNTHVVVEFDDAEQMAKSFDLLAAGGKVTMPLHDAFWGSRFGMVTDAFGIRWMFTADLKKG